MFGFIFKDKPEMEQADPELELARLALLDRVDAMLAKEVHRRLRHAVIATPLHH